MDSPGTNLAEENIAIIFIIQVSCAAMYNSVAQRNKDVLGFFAETCKLLFMSSIVSLYAPRMKS